VLRIIIADPILFARGYSWSHVQKGGTSKSGCTIVTRDCAKVARIAEKVGLLREGLHEHVAEECTLSDCAIECFMAVQHLIQPVT
jgi:hypothetical protein